MRMTERTTALATATPDTPTQTTAMQARCRAMKGSVRNQSMCRSSPWQASPALESSQRASAVPMRRDGAGVISMVASLLIILGRGALTGSSQHTAPGQRHGGRALDLLSRNIRAPLGWRKTNVDAHIAPVAVANIAQSAVLTQLVCLHVIGDVDVRQGKSVPVRQRQPEPAHIGAVGPAITQQARAEIQIAQLARHQKQHRRCAAGAERVPMLAHEGIETGIDC